jgi:nitrile hydratase accessory protein
MSDPLELSGGAAPPMQNGELVFEAPWQGRVFGIAHELAARGAFGWDDFRACLVERIAAWERAARRDEPYRYYDCVLAALETILERRGLLGSELIGVREAEYAARADGHDHHDHDHD